MANGIFDSIKLGKGKRNSFDLSHEVKLSCNMGNLVPILCEPVLPDDTFKVDSEVMMRWAPMIAPLMHNVDVYVHYFFVPNRLVWDKWRDFITGGEDGKDSPSYPRVNINAYNLLSGGLADYLGFPTVDNILDARSGAYFDALPFRAYNLIWNEFYRDQNLQPEIDIMKDVSGIHNVRAYESEYGGGTATYNEGQAVDRFFALNNRAWEKDYFTSALPWTQRGETVRLPLTGEIDITAVGDDTLNAVHVDSQVDVNSVSVNSPLGFNEAPQNSGSLGAGSVMTDDDTDMTTRELLLQHTSNGNNPTISNTPVKLTGVGRGTIPMNDVASRLKGVSETAQSTTINELRRSYALQRWLERNAFGGARYIEQILAHFGVKSSDARLQRPEYLGGGKCPVRVSQVLQTSESTDSSPLGTMAGHGLAVGKTNKFKKYFEEHGYVIGIMSVIPRSSYSQGIPRKFLKFDKLDYAWPEFAHLGEQEVMNKELYYDFFQDPGSNLDNTNQDYIGNRAFGYQSRYAEYKQCSSRVCGDFKTTLDFWHLGRLFSGRPNLNGNFVQVTPDDSKRIWAVQELVDPETGEAKPIDHMWVMINHRIKALRQLPYYGTPI